MMTHHGHWRKEVTFSADGPQPKVLIETARFKSVLVGLESGQKLPPHAGGEAVYHILDGRGWMTAGDERFGVQAGETVTVSDGMKRGIEADTRLVFIASRIA